MRILMILALCLLLAPLSAAKVSGRLVSKGDNKALADIEIQLVEVVHDNKKAPKSWTGKSDQEGRFSWDAAPNELIELRLLSDKWGADLSGLRGLPANSPPPPPPPPGGNVISTNGFPRIYLRNGDGDFGDVRLVAGGSIEVKVVDEWAREAPGYIHVYAKPTSGNFYTTQGPTQKIRGLPVGSVWVFCTVEGFWSCRKEVYVAEGQVSSYTFTAKERLTTGLNVNDAGKQIDKFDFRSSCVNGDGLENLTAHQLERSRGLGLELNRNYAPPLKREAQMARGNWFVDVRSSGFAPHFQTYEVKTRTDVLDIKLTKGVKTKVRMSGPAHLYGSFVFVHADAPALQLIKKTFSETRNVTTLDGPFGVAGLITGQWTGNADVELQLQPGKYWAIARLGDDTLIDLGEVECPDKSSWDLVFEGKTNSLDLTLTEAGQPLASQEFYLVQSFDSLRHFRQARQPELFKVRTDGAGKASLTGLAESMYTVVLDFEAEAIKNGLIHQTDIPIRKFMIKGGANTTNVEAVVSGWTWLSFKLTKPEGLFSDIRSYQLLQRDAHPLDTSSVRTDHEEKLYFGYVQQGTYEFLVDTQMQRSRHEVQRVMVSLEVEVQGLKVDFSHEFKTYSVSGKVNYPRGAKKKGFNASILTGHTIRKGQHYDPYELTGTGDEFTFEGIPGGSYVFQFLHEGLVHNEHVELDKDVKGLKVSFEETGTISLTVNGQKHTRTWGFPEVRLVDKDGADASGIISQHSDISLGSAILIEYVLPGSYKIEVGGYGWVTESESVRIKKGKTEDVAISLTPSAWAELDLRYSDKAYCWYGEDASGKRIAISGRTGSKGIELDLPENCKRVVIKALNYKDVIRDVDSATGKHNKLTAKLERID